MKSAWGEAQTKFFYQLTPERILDVVEEGELICTGRCSALNSLENRVYEIEIEPPQGETIKSPWDKFRIAKFYRPGRWSKEQILQEHNFLLRLHDCDLPVVPPLSFSDGTTLKCLPDEEIYYTLFPKAGGRMRLHDELSDEDFSRLGRLIARIHNVGSVVKNAERMELTPSSYIEGNAQFVLRSEFLPENLKEIYQTVVDRLLAIIAPLFSHPSALLLHGDFHLGNVLWGKEGPIVVDFDDCIRGPAIQDFWLLAPGRDDIAMEKLKLVVEGYEQMREFDRTSLKLVEPLRAMRLVHFSAWIARRWQDPSFSRTFPQFTSHRYWQEHVTDLREQLLLIEESSYS